MRLRIGDKRGARGEAQRPGAKLASYELRPGTNGRPAGVIKEGPP